MTWINCFVYDCKYCDDVNICQAGEIAINELFECDTCVNYKTLPEYQEEYFIAVECADGKRGKSVKCGKKIILNGEEFYTCSHPLANDSGTKLTHARTGYLCGSVQRLKDNWDWFMEKQKPIPDVTELPLAIKVNDEYVLKDEANSEVNNG